MTRRTLHKRFGFSLIEMLVIVAIIAILIGILLPGVQAVRESGNRSRCRANMSQLAKGTLAFQMNYGTLPTYNGVFPVPAGNKNSDPSDTATARNPISTTKNVYGSWFVHLMPYVEQSGPYDQIAFDVGKYSNTFWSQSFPATGTLVSPATPTVYSTGSVWVDATYNQWNAMVSQAQANGGVTLDLIPPKFADPGTNQYVPPRTVVKQGTAAVYDPPGSGPVSGYINIYRTETTENQNPAVGNAPMNIRGMAFSILQCPSDPSATTDPQAKQRGLVYMNNGTFGSTNYLANWNVFSQGNAQNGYKDLPGDMKRITDGASNTIMYGEAYAWCDGIGRPAYLAWAPSSGGGMGGLPYYYGGKHNFGLTLNIKSLTVNGVTYQVPSDNVNGYPHPSPQGLVLPPQFKPDPKPVNNCASGNCCSYLTVQTGHQVLNVAMADGSVKSITKGISLDTWRKLMLPNDGQQLGSDW